MNRWILSSVLLLASFSANSQHFATGYTELQIPSGIVRINSGRVGSFNAHEFYVYSFQLKPDGAEQQWNQVPLVVQDDPELEFMITTGATADFATRDATIRQEGDGVLLTIAQMRFEDTPYDENTWIELHRYRLRHLEDDNRWVFEQIGIERAPPGTTVESYIRSESKS
jgi:hypothetical protein